MHLLLAAASGWGKGYLAQILTYRNMTGDRYDAVVVLDTSNEFRGLCSEEHGPAPATHWTVTDTERQKLDRNDWREMIAANRNLVLERGVAKGEDWREAAAEIIMGARLSNLDVLVVIDEGHGVAPQQGAYPDEIHDLATDGRTEGGSATSSMWLTQRLAQIDKDVSGNCNGRFIGGFEDAGTLSSISDVLPYPKELHSSGGQEVHANLSEDLCAADGRKISVRKWTDPDENGEPQTVNSEWIYSDETGKVERKESNDYEAACDHVGASGKRIDVGI